MEIQKKKMKVSQGPLRQGLQLLYEKLQNLKIENLEPKKSLNQSCIPGLVNIRIIIFQNLSSPNIRIRKY